MTCRVGPPPIGRGPHCTLPSNWMETGGNSILLPSIKQEQIMKDVKQAGAPKGLITLLALVCGVSIASGYYAQPLLGDIGRALGVSEAYAGALPMFTQIGIAIGALLFLPLGDIVNDRKLILAMISAHVGALVLVALAPSAPALTWASALMGVTTITPYLLPAYAARIVPPEQRGHVTGLLARGIFAGILLARTASGYIGHYTDWRTVYWTAAALMMVMTALLAWRLPPTAPRSDLSYPRLLASIWTVFRSQPRTTIWTVFRSQPVVRYAAVRQGLMFGAFNAFWISLVFYLETPRFHMGSQVAGLFGVIGAAGAFAAPLFGKVTAIGKAQAVIEFDTDGCVLEANENFLKVMGYTLEEIKGEHHRMFCDPDYTNSLEYKKFWQKLNRGEFDCGRYKRIGNDGKVIWIQATYNPILDLNGKPYKIVKFASDVTEQVQLEHSTKVKAESDGRKVDLLLASVAKAAQGDLSCNVMLLTAKEVSTAIQYIAEETEKSAANCDSIARSTDNLKQSATDLNHIAVGSVAELSPVTLAALIALVRKHTGIAMNERKSVLLERRLRPRMDALALGSIPCWA
eukprot:gene34082-42028_t